MFARVNIFEGPAEGLDEATRIAQEQVLPRMREMAGSAGLLILADRATGRSLGITLWRSEQALKDSEDAAAGMRQQTAEDSGEKIVAVERYEVLLEERWAER